MAVCRVPRRWLAAAILGASLLVACRSVELAKPAAAAVAAKPIPWPVFAIPRLPAVVIDGDATDWGAGGFRVEALIAEPGEQPGQGAQPARADGAASLRLGWNDTGLLVLLEVTGRDWREAEDANELYAGDSVELYLAPHPGGPDRCQWVVAPGLDARFPEPRLRLEPFGTTPRLRPNAPAPSVARQRKATGYQLEALLPWGALRTAPQLGDAAAFQVMVNTHDREGRAAAHLLWFPVLGAAHDGRRLHRLRLAEKADPPISARASVRVDFRAFKTAGEVFAPAAAAGQEVRLRAAGGVLAAGRLASDASGYARATLTGTGTDEPVVYLEVDGRLADTVPLVLPRPELALETRVRWDESAAGPAVVLGLPAAPPPGYRISRRLPGEPRQVLAEQAPAGEFRDPTVRPETLYEYAIVQGGEAPLTDYFWTGSRIPPRDRRGTVLLLVEGTQAAALTAEIRRLMFDLVGDGWQVLRHDVAATQTPAEIRQWIRAEYDRAPAAVNTVLLLGQVPVFRTGAVRPDGHGGGPSPADVYYGALEGAWTTEPDNPADAAARRQGFGRGRRGRDGIPGPVQLAVGRVDFSGLPAFGVDETTLLRRYLARDHAYRQARLPVAERALVHDHFLNAPERFAYSGWQNFTTLLSPERVQSAEWPNVKPGMNQFFYVCGPGASAQALQFFGSTATLVTTPLEAVFTLVFGSFVYEWDTPDNLLRATLAHERGALTCGWAGRPQWYVHSMGMGETIGDGLRRTQNNDGHDYQPVGDSARGVHIALLGDPTLRLHRVAPPADLRVLGARHGVRLSWTAAPQPVAGYHVYRAEAEFGPYERLSARPVTALTADDPQGTTKHYYQVRAMVLQESTTGNYYNTSQGIFAGPAVASPPPP